MKKKNLFLGLALFLLGVSFYGILYKEGMTFSPNPNIGAKAGAAAGLKPCSTYNSDFKTCKTSLGIKNTGNNGVNLKRTQKTGRCQYNALNKKCY
jgi:hypothetical protein